MSTISRILPQRRRSTLGCELQKTNHCLSCVVYLISLLFTCETNFLGFELDLLKCKFLVRIICWNITSRNPWYLYFYSIYFLCTDSSCLLSVISFLEFLVKNSGYSRTQNSEYPGFCPEFPGLSVTDRF